MSLATSVTKTQRIAAVTTISLKLILDLFQFTPNVCLIHRLKANGSTEVNPPSVHEDRNLGIKYSLARTTNRFDMNYLVDFDDNGNPKNPIDAIAIQTIQNHLVSSNINDAVVTDLELLLNDSKLKQYGNSQIDQFFVKFTSDPVDGDLDKNEVRKHPENMTLVQQSRMQYRILNCRKVIDRHQQLTLPESQWKYQILWIGENLASIRSDLIFAQQLNTHFGIYGILKEYDQTQEDKLILVGVTP